VRRAARTDANLTEVVKALRKLGLRVHVTNGDWDLTVQYGGQTMLCEVRQEGKPRKPRKGNQEAVHEKMTIYWLQTLEDCQQLAKTLRWWAMTMMDAKPAK